jgi:TetR/AcrR family transcriptional repressor of bet genes
MNSSDAATREAGQPETAAQDQKVRRRASKEFRREQLISATIDSIATKGYSATTLADVADGAGLSRGIVNFHFDSKEKLFIETLTSMSDEYGAHWRKALDEAGASSASKLRALIVADLDADICNPRMISAWFAFWAEAATRPAYQDLCWSHDDDYLKAINALCHALKEEMGYAFDADRTATAVHALQEGLWMRLMFGAKDFSPTDALASALEAIGNLFPMHFEHDGTIIHHD